MQRAPCLLARMYHGVTVIMTYWMVTALSDVNFMLFRPGIDLSSDCGLGRFVVENQQGN